MAHEKEEKDICFLCLVQKTKKESLGQQVKLIRRGKKKKISKFLIFLEKVKRKKEIRKKKSHDDLCWKKGRKKNRREIIRSCN